MTEVAGFVLPPELVRVAEQSQWSDYTEGIRLDPLVVDHVFGERPDSTWRFYSIDEVEVETLLWQQESDPAWFGESPDDLEPASSLLIGELGYDRPFALDYRPAVPAVRLLCFDGRWRLVAASASELLQRLGFE